MINALLETALLMIPVVILGWLAIFFTPPDIVRPIDENTGEIIYTEQEISDRKKAKIFETFYWISIPVIFYFAWTVR